MASQSQARVHFYATASEEVVLENEADGMSDLRGLAEPAEGYRRSHACERLGLHRLDQWRADEARGHRADADAVARELFRPHDRHRGNACFGSAVVGLPGVAGARDTGHVHDDAVDVVADHALCGFARTQE